MHYAAHEKVSIRDLSQILTTAPIFLSFDYFTQNIWVSIFVQFHVQVIFGVGAKLILIISDKTSMHYVNEIWRTS